MLSKLRHIVLLPVAAVLIAAATCACQPTGSARCDQLERGWPARADIEAHGWTVDCTPGFSSWNGQRYVSGWADVEHRTVWIWPERISAIHDDAFLIKTLAHESAHVRGIASECAADDFAWHYMKPREREGVGFLQC